MALRDCRSPACEASSRSPMALKRRSRTGRQAAARGERRRRARPTLPEPPIAAARGIPRARPGRRTRRRPIDGAGPTPARAAGLRAEPRAARPPAAAGRRTAAAPTTAARPSAKRWTASEPEPDAAAAPEPAKGGWFSRLKAGLSRSTARLTDSVTTALPQAPPGRRGAGGAGGDADRRRPRRAPPPAASSRASAAPASARRSPTRR